MTSTCDALVVGAGGFLGGHLVRSLLLQGLSVRAVDRSPLERWAQRHAGADNRVADVADPESATAATSGATVVYHLAATPRLARPAERARGALLDTHLLLAARETAVRTFLYASTARPTTVESDAPAVWRDRLAERMARRLSEDTGLPARVARLGAVYGPHDTHSATPPAVPSVVARAVARALLAGGSHVSVPFAASRPTGTLYVDDAVLGLQLVAHGADDPTPLDVVDPAPRPVAEVVDVVLAALGRPHLEVRYLDIEAPPAPAGDPAPLATLVDWQPDIPLAHGVRRLLESVPDAVHPAARPNSGAARTAGRHRYAEAG